MSDDALTRAEVHDQDLTGWAIVLDSLRTRLSTPDYDTGLDLVAAIGAAAQQANHHPDLDLRYGWVGVRLSSHDVGGLSARDVDLARTISTLAAERGCVAQPWAVMDVEVGIDTADAAAVEPFWRAVLGYRSPSPTDSDATGADGTGWAEGDVLATVSDPNGAGPTLWFQASSTRAERGRTHLDIHVPAEVARTRVDAALVAGGRLVTDSHAPAWWVLADPDGSLVCICTWQGDPSASQPADDPGRHTP